jgi:hypothetical protein
MYLYNGVTTQGIYTAMPPKNRTARAVTSALTALVLSLMITFVLALIVPTPWMIAEVLIAVGMSTFFGTLLGAYFAMRS